MPEVGHLSVVQYDKRLTEEEQEVLEKLEDVVGPAAMSTSVYWTFRTDGNGRRLYQLRNDFRSSQGYLEMALHELDGISADDLKRAIVGGSRPCKDEPVTAEHIKERIDDWIQRLRDLYGFVRTELAGVDGVDLRESEVLQATEGLMRQFNVPAGTLPALHVSIPRASGRGRGRIRFLPMVLWVAGANGRVNVSTEQKKHLLLDASHFALPCRWVLYERGKSNRREFDASALVDLVDECR